MPPLIDVGNFGGGIPPGQRITFWLHPTNQYSVPYIGDNSPTMLLMHPGPNLEVPTVQWTNIYAAGSYDLSALCLGDGQPDFNFLRVVVNGVQVADVQQGGVYNGPLVLGVLDTVEFQLTGPSFNAGGNYFNATLTPTGQTSPVWDAHADFVANLGAQTDPWRYFYRGASPAGAPNTSGPMQPQYGPI